MDEVKSELREYMDKYALKIDSKYGRPVKTKDLQTHLANVANKAETTHYLAEKADREEMYALNEF